MNRRNFIRKTAGATMATAVVPKLMAGYRYSESENRSILSRVISKEIPMRWEDSMLSGNGSTGIMVKGLPLDECIIVNHEKFWTVGNDYRPETPDMAEAWVEARKIIESDNKNTWGENYAAHSEEIAKIFPNVKSAKQVYDSK